MLNAPILKPVPNKITRIAVLLLAAATLAIHACKSVDSPATVAGSNKSGPVTFEETAQPLFEHRCIWCHNDEKPNAGLNFENRATVMNPSSRFVVPGNPGESRLYTAVSRDPTHMRSMPADGWTLSDRQKRALHDWIAAGAPWSEGKKGQLHKKNYRVELDEYL